MIHKLFCFRKPRHLPQKSWGTPVRHRKSQLWCGLLHRNQVLLLKPRQSGSSQVISIVKRTLGFRTFVTMQIQEICSNHMKAVLGGKSVLDQIWLCEIYLSTAKKTRKELNRHYDEPQSFSLLQNWNISLKFTEGWKIKGQLFTSIYSTLYHSGLHIRGYITAFLPSAKK